MRPTATPKPERTTVRKLVESSRTVALRYVDIALPRVASLERAA